MAVHAKQLPSVFDPAAFSAFRFLSRELDAQGHVTLRYALGEQISFVEEFDIPLDRALSAADRERVDGLLSLLHWVAGVSYFKTAAPLDVICESGEPTPAGAALLEALYSEGLESSPSPTPSTGCRGHDFRSPQRGPRRGQASPQSLS